MRPAPCGYSSACVLRPHFLFSFRKGNGGARQRKRGPRKTGSASRAAIASEEASSIPFPPGRRKLHIRSLLLPSQIVTVSLGHNLAIWNFTTPHAILMMAGGRHLANTEKPGLPYAASPEQGSGRWRVQRTVRKVLWSSLSFSYWNRKATQRSGRLSGRKKEAANMELSPPRRKRNGAAFF